MPGQQKHQSNMYHSRTGNEIHWPTSNCSKVQKFNNKWERIFDVDKIRRGMDDDNNNGRVCLRGPSSFPAGPAAARSAGTTTFINQDWNNSRLQITKFEMLLKTLLNFKVSSWTSLQNDGRIFQISLKKEARRGEGKRTIRCEKRRARNTFGTKTRQSVPVVQKMMNTEMRTKEALGCSLSTAEMATPSTHMIVTLYTDIPTYLHRFTWSNSIPTEIQNEFTPKYQKIRRRRRGSGLGEFYKVWCPILEILRLFVVNMLNGEKWGLKRRWLLLWVVQSRNLNIAGLPSQKGSK